MEGDGRIGVPPRVAARVIGVSEERLRRWNAAGLVIPTATIQIGERQRWSYGLEDIVQGRIVRQLEDRDVHIRAIRRIVEAARSAVHVPLSSLRWGTSAGEAFVQYPDEQWVGSREPSQAVIIETLNLDLVRDEVRRAVTQRPPEAVGKIERRRGTLGFKPVFAGTRIPVEAVVAYLRRDRPDSDILEAFPDLTPDDLRVARADFLSA